jgi:peroxiredoxin 2/4
MKTKILILIGIFFSLNQVRSQDLYYGKIPLLGDDAPSFTAESTNGPIAFPQDYGKRWKILFSHPRDYTPVCSSEILELSSLQNEFEKLGVSIVVLSTDTLSLHYAWKKDLENIKYKGREPVKIKFPLVSDENCNISKRYGMIHSAISKSKDVRGVFIIGPTNKIEALFYYPMNVGRNMNEIMRTLIALQTARKTELLTPANWKPGEDLMVPFLKDADKEDFEVSNPDIYRLTWFMVFRKI